MDTQHFSNLVFVQANKFGNKTALYHKVGSDSTWSEISWKQLADKVFVIAKALTELGVSEQDRVGQFSQNMAENLIVDFALYANRAIMVPMYATSSEEQVDFITKHSNIEVIFVGDQTQYDIACKVEKSSGVIKRIISFDPNVKLCDDIASMYYSELEALGEKSNRHFEVHQRQQEANENDLACILYTSGTTGNPKGVMMPHSCFLEAMKIHKARLTTITADDKSVAFLPLSHVFERTWSYFLMYMGASNYINLKPLEIQQTLKEIRPTLMCAVPRFWEKVYAGVQENISKMTPFMMGIVTWAVATGKKHNLDYLRIGKKPGLLLKIKYAIADKLIFSKVKKTLGIENANMFPVAGARLSDEILVFFRSIGVPITYGYGLTESTATVCCFDYTGFEVGTVGLIMPDLEVKIGEDNEILLKGKTIFPGYYKNDEANKAAFTEDGWFKTGDAGYLKGKQIVLTERIKDLFKTSNGKYIAPQEIETRLILDVYIEQAAVIGDERNFVTAIIAPNIEALENYAKKNKLVYSSIEELLKLPKIIELMDERIKNAQKGMANYEIIKKFSLIKRGFSIETGELTNTLKMRRAVIMQKYKQLIDEMYV